MPKGSITVIEEEEGTGRFFVESPQPPLYGPNGKSGEFFPSRQKNKINGNSIKFQRILLLIPQANS